MARQLNLFSYGLNSGEPYVRKVPVRFGGRGGSRPSLPLSAPVIGSREATEAAQTGWSVRRYFVSVIYHILTSAEWQSALRSRYYSTDSFAMDGFIHCCTAAQLEYVGERYFRGQQDLIVLCIDDGRV